MTSDAAVVDPPLSLALPQIAQDRFQGVDDLVPPDPAPREAQPQLEQLAGRAVREGVVPRPARLLLGGRFAYLLPGGAALAGDLLDEGGHFFRRILPNYL